MYYTSIHYTTLIVTRVLNNHICVVKRFFGETYFVLIDLTVRGVKASAGMVLALFAQKSRADTNLNLNLLMQTFKNTMKKAAALRTDPRTV